MPERGPHTTRQGDDGRWLPAEPMPEPFGVLPKWVALFTSWRDARAITRTANGA